MQEFFLLHGTSFIKSLLQVSSLPSKRVIWENLGIAPFFNISSQNSAKSQWNASSSDENEDLRVTRCLLSTSRLFSCVALVVECSRRTKLWRSMQEHLGIPWWISICLQNIFDIIFLLLSFAFFLKNRHLGCVPKSKNWINCPLKSLVWNLFKSIFPCLW